MTSILEKILGNPAYDESDRKLVEMAFEVAKSAHVGQKRLSGEEYLSHPLRVAYFLSELGLDIATVVAGILHDTIEDTPTTYKDIEKEFGKDIAFLVEGVTKLSKIEYDGNPNEKKSSTVHLNSLKKMIFAMAEDIRVILIKLADRYHNMETLKYIDRTKPVIKRHLTDSGIKILEMNSRAKHYYSLYGKMLRKEMDADKIFDLVAMRIIVPDINSCY